MIGLDLTIRGQRITREGVVETCLIQRVPNTALARVLLTGVLIAPIACGPEISTSKPSPASPNGMQGAPAHAEPDASAGGASTPVQMHDVRDADAHTMAPPAKPTDGGRPTTPADSGAHVAPPLQDGGDAGQQPPAMHAQDAMPPLRESDPAAYTYAACNLPTGLVRIAVVARRGAPQECVRVVLVQKGDTMPSAGEVPAVSGVEVTAQWAVESATRSTQLDGCSGVTEPRDPVHASSGSGSFAIRRQDTALLIQADVALDFVASSVTERVRLRFPELTVKSEPSACN
jgi:hypothetical protein